MDKSELLTKEVAHITKQSAEQVLSLEKITVEHIFPPIEAGGVPIAMPPQMHFRTFVSVLLVVIEFGTENAAAITRARIQMWRSELHLLVARLDAYLQLNYTRFEPLATNVCDTLLNAINEDFAERFHDLGLQGIALHQSHPTCPPAEGSGDSAPAPKMRRLKNRTDKEHPNNLVEQSRHWNAAPAAGTKRKAAAAPAKAPAAKQAATGVGPVPAGYCKGFSHGSNCRRPGGILAHVSGRDAATLQQQHQPQTQQQQQYWQQPQWLPQQPQQPFQPPLPPAQFPPLPTPQQPQQQPQRPPQQQQPAAVGAPPQASVANFSRVADGGRGG